MKYFILGPIIVLLAFTLRSWPIMLLQVAMGLFYLSLGFEDKNQ